MYTETEPVKMEGTISATNDLPEEIVLEILYKLHIRTLLRFKCVSKLYNSTISNPKFGRNYLHRPRCRLSGMLYPYVDCSDDPNRLRHNTDDAPPSLHVTAFSRPIDPYHIMGSSNGLILSCLPPQAYPALDPEDACEWEHELCVSNPLTKQSVGLRKLWVSVYPWGFGLAMRPGGGYNQDYLSFRVVFVQLMRHRPHPADSTDFGTIDIFCSDTGRWTRKERIRCSDTVLSGRAGRAFAYKGILHWFEWNTKTIITYDPYDNPDGFGSIQLPSGAGKKVMNSGEHLIRLGYEDMIEFGEIEDCGGDRGWKLCVWRLVDYDKREWCLEKTCPISPLWKEGLLSDCRLLVAPYPWNDEFFCCLFVNRGKVAIHDLASSEEVFVAPFEVKTQDPYYLSKVVGSLVSIVLNPWSSPLNGQAGSNSSSEAGFGAIIPAWFPS